MYQMAIYMASLYFFSLNLLVFVFNYVARDLFPKVIYIYIGIIGTVLVIVSLGYVFRKHYLKNLSRMKTWLDLHVVTGSIGSFGILVHSEFHFRALLPSLTLIFMELVVISGVIGRYLISHLTKQISQEKAQAAKMKKEQGEMGETKQSAKDEEEDVLVLVFSVSMMRNWKMVHVQLTSVLTVLTVLHVISELYYRGMRL